MISFLFGREEVRIEFFCVFGRGWVQPPVVGIVCWVVV